MIEQIDESYQNFFIPFLIIWNIVGFGLGVFVGRWIVKRMR